MSEPTARKSPIPLAVGLPLVVPALVLLLVSYVEPTIWTLRASVQELRLFPVRRDNDSSGGFTLENFDELFQRGFVSDVAAVYLSQRFLEVPVSLVLPVALFGVLFLLIVAAQLLYLDRVALRVGRPEHDRPGRGRGPDRPPTGGPDQVGADRPGLASH